MFNVLKKERIGISVAENYLELSRHKDLVYIFVRKIFFLYYQVTRKRELQTVSRLEKQLNHSLEGCLKGETFMVSGQKNKRNNLLLYK